MTIDLYNFLILFRDCSLYTYNQNIQDYDYLFSNLNVYIYKKTNINH